jgi:pre-mRNA-splicing factor CDC5/CEF1
VGQTLRRLENKRKPEEEEAERKKRQRKNDAGKEGEGANHPTKFIAARDAQIQKLKEAESIGRRRKLVLPTAQVGGAELEDIVKIGQGGENAKALVGGGSDASGRLLSDYEGLDAARMARTPRTAPQGRDLWKQYAHFNIYLFIFNRRQRDDGGQKSAQYDYRANTFAGR